ncbi:MAG: NAD-dependent epimerase/dehydratase family protein [Bacteroidota bacterium]
MITVGNGMLAKAFRNRKMKADVILFASGVSNSLENEISEFERERLLLKDVLSTLENKTIVYFSTCSIYDDSVNNNAYVKHKLLMENLIKKSGNNYLICRVSNVVGGNGNQNTIFNFFMNKIRDQEIFEVWKNAERNLIDIDDVVFIVSKIIEKGIINRVLNIANRKNYQITDIIEKMETFTGKIAIHKLLDKGCPLNIDVSYLEGNIKEYVALFDVNYLNKLLNKYYTNE